MTTNDVSGSDDPQSEAERLRARLAELDRQAEAERMRERLAQLEREAAEAKAAEEEAARAKAAADAEAAAETETERMRARLAQLEAEAEAAKAGEAARAAAAAAAAEAAEEDRMRERLAQLEREAEQAKADAAAREAAAQAADEERTRARLAELEREAAATKAAAAAAAAAPAAAAPAVTNPAAAPAAEPAPQWAEPARPKGRKGLIALIAVEVVALVAASAFLVATLIGLPVPGVTGEGGVAAAITAGPEVQLVQASTVGAAPFNEIPFAPIPDATIALASTQANPAADTQLLTTAVAGDTDFIYGFAAAGGDAVCNRTGLGDYYAGDATAAAAFAEAIDSDDDAVAAAGGSLTAAGVGDYVKGLFRATLIADTLVTVAGRTDDGTENEPAVLQRGTAVLIDSRGVPRVKCFGANPLLAAPAIDGAPTFVGTAWSGFLPNGVATITPSSESLSFLATLQPGGVGGAPFAIQSPLVPQDGLPAPAALACQPSGYDPSTTATSFTVTNSTDAIVLYSSQDSQDTGCGVVFQRALAPGQSFTYPASDSTFVPYPGIQLLATSPDASTTIIWQASITQGQTSATITR